MVAMEINQATMSPEESDQEMATATTIVAPFVLLRRPLPPKNKQTPTPANSGMEDEFSETTDYVKILSKSPDVSSIKRFTTTKSKANKLPSEVRYHGDVPLPIKSVVKPFKMKGPDPLPPRPPRKLRELPIEAFIKDSYTRPLPEFTLKDFERKLPSRAKLNDDGYPMISDQNYEKFTSWFAANKPIQSAIHSIEIDSSVHVPDVTPRVPDRQLLIEMHNFPSPDQELRHITDYSSTGVPVTPAVSKQTLPTSTFALLPPIETENVLNDFENKSGLGKNNSTYIHHIPTKSLGQTTVGNSRTVQETKEENTSTKKSEGPSKKELLRARFDLDQLTSERKDQCVPPRDKSKETKNIQRTMAKEQNLNLDIEPFVAHQGREIILPTSQPEYFQREELPRTSSPFVSAEIYDSQLSAMEAAVLNAMLTGSSVLNLRAHFLSQLPNLRGLAGMLTHLNLSFNQLWVFPLEILQLVNLVSLKLRNNPIKQIPYDIKVLKRLVVFEIPFNSLTSLPSSLFQLRHLEILDLAYNHLSFIPSDIGKLSGLRELNLEGNQLGAMPMGALSLNLKYLKIRNNFMHPLLWRETVDNQPQRLTDLSALAVFSTGIKNENLPEALKRIMESNSRCDYCDGPMFGPGVQVIRAPSEIFGFRNLPFLFNVCTQTCRREFSKNPESLNKWMKRNVPID